MAARDRRNDPLDSSRLSRERRAVEKNKHLGFLIAAIAAALLLVGYWLPRHPDSNSGATAASAEATVPPVLVTADAQPSAESSAPSGRPTRVVVYLCGDVRRPGVYDMATGNRVADGIARAGGALGDADLEQLNLAEPLSDAMKICVPHKGEHLALSSVADVTASGDPPRPSRRHHGSRSSHKLQPGQTLNVNAASASELTQLPGVGPSLAARIVEYRTENGLFQSVDDLQNVSGIGPSKFEKMASFIRL